MVKAAEEGQGDDAAMIGWLDRPRFGRVLVENEVRAERRHSLIHGHDRVLAKRQRANDRRATDSPRSGLLA